MIRLVGGGSILFDASAEGVDPALDLDGLSFDAAANQLLLSFDASGEVDGVVFDDEDVLLFDPSSGAWSLELDASALAAGFGPADVQAIPEPAAGWLLGAGAVFLSVVSGWHRHRRRGALR